MVSTDTQKFIDNDISFTELSNLIKYTYQSLISQAILFGIFALFTVQWKSFILFQISIIAIIGFLPLLCILRLFQKVKLKKQYKHSMSIFLMMVSFLYASGFCIIGVLDNRLSLFIEFNKSMPYMNQLALFGTMALITLFFFRYFKTLSTSDPFGWLRNIVSNQLLILILLCFLCLITALQLSHFFIDNRFIVNVIQYTCLVIGIEIHIRTFMDFFRPANYDKWELPFESKILYLIIYPHRIHQTIMDSLDYQLGFAASKTFESKKIQYFLLKFFMMSVLLIWALSASFIVETHEQAIITHFGKLNHQVYYPGIHYKWPWPIEKVHIFNTSHINKIHVGSHQIINNQQRIFKENVPILWTNIHGSAQEELMIVSPTQSIEKRDKSQDSTQIPSVSLVGSDIYIEYVIDNLLEYVRYHQHSERFLEEISKRAVSKYLFRFDIDTLLGKGRGIMSSDLKHEIQKLAKEAKSGIKIIYVGFSGVHPPQQVAQSFHETVSSIQLREMQIQKARQYQAKVLSETAGSYSNAKKMISLITQMEENRTNKTNEKLMSAKGEIQQLILHSKGKVSVIIDQARAYRWAHKNKEQGRAIRFDAQYDAFKESPKMYSLGHYYAALSQQLQKSKKYLLLTDTDSLLLRLNKQTSKVSPNIYYPQVKDPDEIDGKKPVNKKKDNRF